MGAQQMCASLCSQVPGSPLLLTCATQSSWIGLAAPNPACCLAFVLYSYWLSAWLSSSPTTFCWLPSSPFPWPHTDLCSSQVSAQVSPLQGSPPITPVDLGTSSLKQPWHTLLTSQDSNWFIIQSRERDCTPDRTSVGWTTVMVTSLEHVMLIDILTCSTSRHGGFHHVCICHNNSSDAAHCQEPGWT